jgi:hypothetical protein
LIICLPTACRGGKNTENWFFSIEDKIWWAEYNKEINMAERVIDFEAKARDEDRVGNNAAFTCPRCGKVFIVSGHIPSHKDGRTCPWCGQSKGYAPRDNKDPNGARIQWEGNDIF